MHLVDLTVMLQKKPTKPVRLVSNLV
jgi:hypothetical protein